MKKNKVHKLWHEIDNKEQQRILKVFVKELQKSIKQKFKKQVGKKWNI